MSMPPLDADIEHRLNRVTRALPDEHAMAAAGVDLFLSGVGGSAQRENKKARNGTKKAAGEAGSAQELVDVLMQNKRRITIASSQFSIQVSGYASHQHNEGEVPTVTLLIWGDQEVDFRPVDVSSGVTYEVTLDTGDRWTVAYIGGRVRLSLRALLLTFMVTA